MLVTMVMAVICRDGAHQGYILQYACPRPALVGIHCFQAALLDTCKFVIPEIARSCGVQLRLAASEAEDPLSEFTIARRGWTSL